MTTYEVNFDGLVGPTHHYAGLAEGNLAASANALSISNPQEAALQGLHKMKLLHDLGLKQAILPPHFRPNLDLLEHLGFCGSLVQKLNKARHQAPALLSACYSAASMWAANTATVTPSMDTADGKVHFTAANLISNLHRAQESAFSTTLLQKLFPHSDYFIHHNSLPKSGSTGDEGAANHNRLAQSHQSCGIHLFVYGKKACAANLYAPARYPARQSFEASAAIARLHQLPDSRIVFAQQNPTAIDAGVFHNDVISVANESVFLVHEQAFVDQTKILKELEEKADFPLQIIVIKQTEISLFDAVNSYLFNSQLLTLPSGSMLLLAPSECETLPCVKSWIDKLIAEPKNPIQSVQYVNLRQSMRNGGGPACLRLRAPLTEHELAEIHQSVLINDSLFEQLKQWVTAHYRTSLQLDDLADPSLVTESYTALDELTQLLQLGSLYDFQRI